MKRPQGYVLTDGRVQMYSHPHGPQICRVCQHTIPAGAEFAYGVFAPMSFYASQLDQVIDLTDPVCRSCVEDQMYIGQG